MIKYSQYISEYNKKPSKYDYSGGKVKEISILDFTNARL